MSREGRAGKLYEPLGGPPHVAKALGCRVVATARRESRLGELEELGCDLAIVDDGDPARKGQGCKWPWLPVSLI